ncbi:hypothetical protein LNKW23_10550 [Paralimibaculum aggregatum]|uniref:histidine kinase n=1 Tax=Paralimibaculum aggregatum TaxID=3036245 RepID=A0ABQ6LER7_9RHOB|nr:ATP-binding protein [Limibaculum sp. NKW23]GMG81842.1 hypothetical protein LNKW23_10550 [Limibaculum sp. NKW23]
MLLRPHHWPIRLKFFAIVVPLMVTVVPSITFYAHYHSYGQIVKEIDARAQHLATSQSILLSRIIQVPDPELLTLLGAGMIVDPDVESVGFYDRAGRQIALVGQVSEATQVISRRINAYGRDDGTVIGHFELGISHARAEQMLAGSWLHAGLLSVIAVLTMLIGGYVAFHRLVGRPLDKVQRAIEGWRAGAPVPRPCDMATDEIGRLARAFHELQTLRIEREAELEAIKQELEDRVVRRTADLQKARDAAEAADRSKASFLAAMSHEIRTPMNGILGIASALAADDRDPEDREKVLTILESGRSLMELLNDILDLSKIDAGRMDIAETEGDLGSLIRQIGKLWQPLAREKQLSFRLEIAPELPARLVFDPTRVRQCATNLISNAVKFTDSGGVEISLRPLGEPDANGRISLALIVRDTGIGIPEAARPRLFESFTQADDSTTRRFGGTGLGLAITRRLAGMMEGDLRFASTENVGTVFTLTFRAGVPAAGSLPAPVPAPPSGLPEAPPPVDLQGRRILVVDDVATNRLVARLMLEPTGAEVIEAADGGEALETLGREAIDLVLLDLHMPVLDGVETISRIRRFSGPVAEVPVIALTADARPERQAELAALGVAGYVTKPISLQLLYAAVAEALPAHEAPEAPARQRGKAMGAC